MRLRTGIAVVGITAGSFAQQTWIKSPYNPVVLDAPFAVEGMTDPTLCFDGQTYHLWISGGGFVEGNPTPSVRTGYYTSTDFVTWDPALSNPVLREGPPGEWDSGHIETPHILKQTETFWLYYCATPDSAPDDEEQLRFGLVTSPDGIQWTRHPDNPILNRGAWEDWDGRWIESPCVLIADSIYYMWYNGVDRAWRIHIGLATSRDGVHWTKHPDNPVLSPDPEIEWQSYAVYAPQVRRIQGRFIMLYTGLKLGETTYDFSDLRTGLAVSEDGVHWERSQHPVLTGSPGAWDEIGPFTLDWIAYGDSLRMFYTSEGLGIAVSTPVPVKADQKPRVSPGDWATLSNYPNPFNRNTQITYRIGRSAQVTLTVWDMKGRAVRRLVDRMQSAGSHHIRWDGRSRDNREVSSGIYILGLQTGGIRKSARILLIR